jgi:hypothetical protein
VKTVRLQVEGSASKVSGNQRPPPLAFPGAIADRLPARVRTEREETFPMDDAEAVHRV